ncbi:23 kDa integral membrane protein [Anabrus simplex]|uniref:23 kDa integral membrane protein n=1 Tax=Anabrus simplex TaxID=316456 RepID=UPI0034DD092F
MAPNHDLNRGMRCIKYMLFLFNLVIVITGVMLMTLGITIKSFYDDYVALLDNQYLPPTTFIVVIGGIIFMVAFFGCCGAIRESTCMIMLFAVMLGIVFVLELAAGITAYVLQSGLSEVLMKNMLESMDKYGTDQRLTESMNFVQGELHCCGVNGSEDWKRILESTDDFDQVPASCCMATNGTDPMTGDNICKPYPSGCLPRLHFLLSEGAFLLASAAITIAFLQLLGVSFACSLGRSIRVYKTERERKRQELQERLLKNYTLGNTDPKRTFPVYFMDSGEGNHVQ